MAERNVFATGDIEDHTGRKLRPSTFARMVQMEDGKSVEAKVAELLAKFSEYLPKNGGGEITGNVNITNGRMSISNWGAFSAGTDGHVMYAQNAYKNPIDNKYYYLQTHESMGAKGILMRHGASGIYWFDTGMIPTVADQEFTPQFRRIDRPDADLINGTDLNNLKDNGVYCGEKLINSPDGGNDWWYVWVQNLTGTPSSYLNQFAIGVNAFAIYSRNCINGGWGTWDQIITGAGGNVTGPLTIRANGGNGLQLVGTDHVYIPIYKNGVASGRSGHIGFPDSGGNTLNISNELSGGAINLSAPGGAQINGQRIPLSFYSTNPPSSSDGQDGDTWDVYV